jgi:nuclear pore complex protein Nup133
MYDFLTIFFNFQTLLSLAKLSMLASDVPTEVAEIELRSIEYDLNIILAQEQLPACILESYGFNPQSMRPLTARELIELYIGDDNSESDQVDFKKALDLVEYIAPLGGNLTDLEAEREAVRLKIWARSVLKDSWLTLNTDEPIEAIKDTVFFKLVEFCYIQGLDLKENMPAPDRLLEADELEHLKSNANFQFLLRTGYEHVRRHCSSEDQQDDSMLT